MAKQRTPAKGELDPVDRVGGLDVHTTIEAGEGRGQKRLLSWVGDPVWMQTVDLEEPWKGDAASVRKRHLAAMAYVEARVPTFQERRAKEYVDALERPRTARAAFPPEGAYLLKGLDVAAAAREEWDAGLRRVLAGHGIRPETCEDPAVGGAWREAALALGVVSGEWSKRAAKARVPRLDPGVVFGAGAREGWDGKSRADEEPARIYVVENAAEGLALWQMLKGLGDLRQSAVVALGMPRPGHELDLLKGEVWKRARTGQRVDVVTSLVHRANRPNILQWEIPKVLGENFGGVTFGVYQPPSGPSWIEAVGRRERDWIRKQGFDAREWASGRGFSI